MLLVQDFFTPVTVGVEMNLVKHILENLKTLKENLHSAQGVFLSVAIITSFQSFA